MEDFIFSYVNKILDDLGIDIQSDDYAQNPNWKQVESTFAVEGFAMPLSWWVEKNIVGQERLEKIYGPYYLGVERKLTDEELCECTWFKALTISILLVLDTIGKVV